MDQDSNDAESLFRRADAGDQPPVLELDGYNIVPATATLAP